MLQAAREGGRTLLERVICGAVVMGLLVAAGLLAGGCGRQNEDRAASAPHSTQAVAASQSGVQPVDTRAAGMPAGEADGVAPTSVSADSLPPDVAASVLEGRVLPGSTVEITAEGSPDVVAVTLGDRTGGRQLFAFDASSGLWRVAYRVPVRTAGERIALSVTARNASGRWRRVWTFLSVESKPEVDVPADSVSTGNP